MKATRTAVNTAKKATEKATAQVTNQVEQATKFMPVPTAAKYNERMTLQSNIIKSPSRAFSLLLSLPTVSAFVEPAQFKNYLAYMKKRHNIEGSESPRRGWSVWYSLQWCEQYAKTQAKNGDKAAQKYLNTSITDLAKQLAEKAQ